MATDETASQFGWTTAKVPPDARISERRVVHLIILADHFSQILTCRHNVISRYLDTMVCCPEYTYLKVVENVEPFEPSLFAQRLSHHCVTWIAQVSNRGYVASLRASQWVRGAEGGLAY